MIKDETLFIANEELICVSLNALLKPLDIKVAECPDVVAPPGKCGDWYASLPSARL